VSVPSAGGHPGERRIAFIHHSSRSESSVDIGRGVAAAAEAFGFELVSFDPDFDQARREQCVADAIALRPDLIVATVVAPHLVPDQVAEAAALGIPWIAVGAVQAPFPGVVAQVAPDEAALTAMLDRWMLDRLLDGRAGDGEPVEIGAWIAPELGEGLIARDRQRAADLARAPGVREVVTHEIALDDLERDVRASTERALDRHPGIQGLWQTCEPCVATQALTLDALGLTGADRPLIAGFYSNRATRRLVRDGRVGGLVQVDTRVQGLVAVDLAVQHWVAGRPWPAPDVDPLGAYGVPLGRPWVIDRTNVGGDPGELRPPGPDPLAFFARRWREQLRVG
jgi:ABC-type sugar transport system substrate-binding protein